MDKIFNLLNLRIRIMVKHWSFLMMYVLLCIVTIILVSQLYEELERGVEIPVGFVDHDNSRFSEYVIYEMADNPLVEVVMFEENEGLKAVKNQQVEVLYTIVEGAEEKTKKGDFDELFEMTYLEGNYFASMLSDIFSGEYLNEISLRLASDYYERGFNRYIDGNTQLDDNNLVYEIGQNITYDNRDSYFIKLTLLDDGEVMPLEWYNQNVLFEKMTIGIIYIFIAFFIMFGGIHILKDRQSMIYLKVRQTGVSRLSILMAEYMSLVIGGLFISIPLTIVSSYYGENMLDIFIINGLYIFTTSAMIYVFLHFFKRVMSYTIIGTGLVVGMGIVSGSFFSIETLSEPIANIARIFPSFYSVQAYFDKGFIKEYSIYTFSYVLITLALSYVIDRRHRLS